MRAEVEQAYQGGGDVGPPEPALTVDQIVARTTDPGPGQSLQSMIIQNREQALERLRAGQTKITERRERQQQADESAKWLSFAQGMLAPTKTGSFGESLGVASGALAEQTATRAEHEAYYDEQLDSFAAQEIAVEAEAIDQMLKLSGSANANKATASTHR